MRRFELDSDQCTDHGSYHSGNRRRRDRRDGCRHPARDDRFRSLGHGGQHRNHGLCGLEHSGQHDVCIHQRYDGDWHDGGE